MLLLASAGRLAHAQPGALPDAVDWSTELAGQPRGAPVVAGSVIAVPLAGGVLAGHRRSDGQAVWKVPLGAEQPLAADEQRLYVAAGDSIHALDPATGSTIWRVPLGGKPTTAPVPRGGWVIAAAAGEILALRAEDGAVVWRKVVGPIEFRPSLDGELLIAPLVEGSILALDVRTGDDRWEFVVESAPTEPVAIGDRVYFGTLDKSFYVLDAATGRRDWRWRIGAEVRGRAALDDRHVYFVAMDNVLRAVDLGNGAQRWKAGLTYRPAAGPVVLGSLVVVPGDVDVLPVFAAVDGKPAGTISFSARLAVLPVFTVAPGGSSEVIAVTGSLENRWTMWSMRPSPVPALPMQPLTELPGEAVPLPAVPTPPS